MSGVGSLPAGRAREAGRSATGRSVLPRPLPAAALAAVTLAAVMLTVGACGGGTTPPGTGAGTPVAPPAPVGAPVTVGMTDFRLALSPRTLVAGTYTFVARNAGSTVHAIEIVGPGVGGERTQGLVQPGESAELTVTLQPGEYELYCPVDGHKGLGMDAELRVTAAASVTSGATR